MAAKTNRIRIRWHLREWGLESKCGALRAQVYNDKAEFSWAIFFHPTEEHGDRVKTGPHGWKPDNIEEVIAECEQQLLKWDALLRKIYGRKH